MKSLARDQVRNLDRIAVERFGIPAIVLMENAGRGATDAFLRRLSPSREQPVLVVAGRGNNGGDGFVIARHLMNAGYRVDVAILGESAAFRGPGEAGVNFGIVERIGVSVRTVNDEYPLEEHLVRAAFAVDAVLGTGLAGEVRGRARDAIDALNAADAPVFAVDIPSGLDCDTGRPLGVAVRAVATATFAAMKTGFGSEEAAAYTGPVDVIGIGCPLVWE